MIRRLLPRCALVLILALVALAGELSAQPARARLRLIAPDGMAEQNVTLGFHRGYAAVPFETLVWLGWTLAPTPTGGQAVREGERVQVRERSPFFHWNDILLQLTHEPYRLGDDLWVPLQLLADFLPQHSPEEYAFHADRFALAALTPAAWSMPEPAAFGPAPAAGRREQPARPNGGVPVTVLAPVRVVIIDPGHGGADTGARGPRGVREKEVALQLALALAQELGRRPDLEVHLTRDSDRLVPLWERGEWATQIKGDRPGIFISLHANSGSSLAARGFETYFLSEARTEHERRVAALENASFGSSPDTGPSGDAGLDFILRELRNLDYQHWSALLAQLIQERVAPVHPGPNRGVKQAPLAVITNALMPAVLVEMGFISNRAEEQLLASADFHSAVARAMAETIERFFERYPPGASAGAGQR